MSVSGITRRGLIGAAGAGLAWAVLPFTAGADEGARGVSESGSGFSPSEGARRALASSPLVYVSPLRSDGRESRCHGEVWFFEDAGDVVIGTGRDRWKGRAVAAGLDRARVWVGDFGPVSRAGDRYRAAPTFLTRASLDTDPATFERLLARFASKYADEWGKWGPRFEKSYADGSRILIRYAPIAG